MRKDYNDPLGQKFHTYALYLLMTLFGIEGILKLTLLGVY